MKFNILFYGTPQFAIPPLKKLYNEHHVIGVVTQPDKPIGRKQILTAPPIKMLAEELNIPVFQPEKTEDLLKTLKNDNIHFLVTAAYGQYIPTKILQLPFKFALNIHPSILPRYRGATPMQSALLNGDKETGVSIIGMTKEMDAGPLFMQQQFKLKQNMKYPELEMKCSEIGANLLCKVIKNINSLSAQPQPNKGISLCTKIAKQDGLVDWLSETAEQVFNKLRAFTPWPGVSTKFKDQKLSLLNFIAYPEKESGNIPGTIQQDEDGVWIQCLKGSIKLQQVQLAGKNSSDIKSFLNGYPEFIGSHL